MWVTSIVLYKGKMSYGVTGSLLYTARFESPISPGYMSVHFLVKETDTKFNLFRIT